MRLQHPWPYMPQQQHDDNTERVALRRRVVEDDQWVVPHELYLAMFSPSCVNVLPFDPAGRGVIKQGLPAANLKAAAAAWKSPR